MLVEQRVDRLRWRGYVIDVRRDALERDVVTERGGPITTIRGASRCGADEQIPVCFGDGKGHGGSRAR